MLPTPGSTLGIPVILDVVDVEIQELLGLVVLDENNLLVDNVTNHLWSRIIANNDLLRFEHIWKIKLIRKGDHLYVPLSTSIQLFYTMEQKGKLHKQFSHPSATKLCDLLKTGGTKTIAPKTLEKLEYLVSNCEPCQKIKTAPKRYRVSWRDKDNRFNV